MRPSRIILGIYTFLHRSCSILRYA